MRHIYCWKMMPAAWLMVVLCLFRLLCPTQVSAGHDKILVCEQKAYDCYFLPTTESASKKNLPFFAETNLVPGDVAHQTLTIVNQTDSVCFLEMRAREQLFQPDQIQLAKVINLHVFDDRQSYFGGIRQSEDEVGANQDASYDEQENNVEDNLAIESQEKDAVKQSPQPQASDTKYQTLFDLYRLDFIKLGRLRPGRKRDYHWLAVVDKWRTTNHYQGSETRFDVDVAVTCAIREKQPQLKEDIQISSGQVKGVFSSVPLDSSVKTWLFVGAELSPIVVWKFLLKKSISHNLLQKGLLLTLVSNLLLFVVLV